MCGKDTAIYSFRQTFARIILFSLHISAVFDMLYLPSVANAPLTLLVFGRGTSILFLEALGKIGRAGESHHIAHLIHTIIACSQEGSRMLQTYDLNHLIWRDICQILDFGKKTRARHSQF